MYKNYIPELPDKYNEINEKLADPIVWKNNNYLELLIELEAYVNNESLKFEELGEDPINLKKRTFLNYPIEIKDIDNLQDICGIDLTNNYKNLPSRYVQIGHLCILESKDRTKSWYDYNFTAEEIQDIILENKVNNIFEYVKYGFNYDNGGCFDKVCFWLEYDHNYNKYFLSNWS